MSDATQVVNNDAANRFELTVAGHLAELVYRRDGDQLVLVHTEVPSELEGKGIGGILVTAAIDYAEQQGLVVVADCPFARGWLQRHPEVAQRVKMQ